MPSLLEAISPDSTRFERIEKIWFQKKIVAWFKREGRKLPWRESSDPYKIWISESMCQQTGVSTVIPYYLRFLDKFPSLEDLAKSKEDEVLKLWEGLGYYQRARNLRKAAQILVDEFEGKFPQTREELLRVPGIGPYTAGAILSIAFRISTPALDGNLIRVYSRYCGIEEPVDQAAVLKKLWLIAAEFKVSKAVDSREFVEGLMDLGAQICTPKNPKCLLCPVREKCRAFERQIQDRLPMKSKKTERLKLKEWVFINRKKKKIGFLQKGSDPKYPHFLRLPYQARTEVPEEFICRLKYSVTHRDFEVFVLDAPFPEQEKLKWLNLSAAEKILLPAIDRKILNLQFG